MIFIRLLLELAGRAKAACACCIGRYHFHIKYIDINAEDCVERSPLLLNVHMCEFTWGFSTEIVHVLS
jgi:hypothetical protein